MGYVLPKEFNPLLDEYELCANSIPGTNMARISNANGQLVVTIHRDVSFEVLKAKLLEKLALLECDVSEQILRENIRDFCNGSPIRIEENAKDLRNKFKIVE